MDGTGRSVGGHEIEKHEILRSSNRRFKFKGIIERDQIICGRAERSSDQDEEIIIFNSIEMVIIRID